MPHLSASPFHHDKGEEEESCRRQQDPRRINGKSEQEREGYRNNDAGTVSFLLFPILVILSGGSGGGSAVECSVLHLDNGVDEILNS